MKMRSWLSLILLSLSLATLPAQASIPDLSDSVSADEFFESYVPPRGRPNALSVEFGGRAGIYSVNYDHVLEDHITLGAGVSTFSISEGASSRQAIAVPIFANAYPWWGKHRPFATLGTNLTNTSQRPSGYGYSASGDTGAYAILGAGYEYRGPKALLFRLSAYTLAGKLSPWLGGTLGYSF
jgi:hypothetical protein